MVCVCAFVYMCMRDRQANREQYKQTEVETGRSGGGRKENRGGDKEVGKSVSSVHGPYLIHLPYSQSLAQALQEC